MIGNDREQSQKQYHITHLPRQQYIYSQKQINELKCKYNIGPNKVVHTNGLTNEPQCSSVVYPHTEVKIALNIGFTKDVVKNTQNNQKENTYTHLNIKEEKKATKETKKKKK